MPIKDSHYQRKFPQNWKTFQKEVLDAKNQRESLIVREKYEGTRAY